MNVFLAYPFTQLLGKDGIADNESIEILQRAIIELEKCGHHVFSAHKREKFGQELMPPEVCTILDYNGIEDADIILAYPGEPISGGVHVELGWASALNKPIVLFLKKKVQYSPLITGMVTKTTTLMFYFEESILECFPEVLQMLSNSVIK